MRLTTPEKFNCSDQAHISCAHFICRATESHALCTCLPVNWPRTVNRRVQHMADFIRGAWSCILLHLGGVITPNQIPLTTMVTYIQKSYRSRISKSLSHNTCMQCGTSHLQTVQENILSHIIFSDLQIHTKC